MRKQTKVYISTAYKLFQTPMTRSLNNQQ